MHVKERNLVKKAINTRLDRLHTILNANQGNDQPGSNKDESTRLNELSHIPVDETILNIARHEQAGLKANLKWLESDDAGLCQVCEEKIPIQRLLTVPTTRNCINCAKDEQQ